MTPHRTGGKSGAGSFVIDRVFPGVGRIRRSSGTDNAKEFQRRDLLLTELFEHAQLDVLHAFKAGSVTIGELLEAKRRGRLTSASLLADMKLRGNLWSTFRSLFPAPRNRYRISIEKLERVAGGSLGATATVADLARIEWAALRVTWGGSAADWNHLRRAVSRGLTLLLADKYHPFRRSVVQAIPIAREKPRVPELSAAMFWEIVAHAPEYIRPAFVTLIATGLRVGEYLALTPAHLRASTCSIDVQGTKTAGSAATVYVAEDLWPWVVKAVPCPLRYRHLSKRWSTAVKAAGAGDLRLHDLRHAFAQMASDAGAPTARVQAALRHASPDMTRRYEMQKSRREVASLVGIELKGGRKAG